MRTIKISGIEFDIGKAIDAINDIGAETVLLQVPDGLKRKTKKLMEYIPAEVDLWGGSCYGACDLPLFIEHDALIHVGHSPIPDTAPKYPVIYLEGRDKRWSPPPDKIFEVLDGEVALYSTVQYLNHMERTSDILKKEGYKTVRGEASDRIKYPGQILGCDYSVNVKEADSHLYIGTGRFHPLGLSMVLDEIVRIFDPVKGEIDSIDDGREGLLRKRHVAISRISTSEKDILRIGIIVSRKPGQEREELAEGLKKKSPENFRISIIYTDGIIPRRLDDLGWDILVNTACPRITLDDSTRFKTTILSPVEYLIAVEEKDWEDWSMDEIH